MNYKAFIFDLDGTLINNMQVHLPVWEQIVAKYGGHLKGEALLKELYGENEKVLQRIFGDGHFSERELMRIGKEKEALYRQQYASQFTEVNGASDFIMNAWKNGILLAMGTAAIVENIDFTFQHLPLKHYFSAIVGRYDVINSKPHPETFLKAAEQLGVKPSECLVFEDTPKGVECAVNAGMDAIVITTSHSEDDFKTFKNILSFVPDFTALSSVEFIRK